MKKNIKAILAFSAVAAVSAAAIGGAYSWWKGRGLSGGLSIPGVSEAIANEKFEALDCQAKYFESSPALALMFTAPLDSSQSYAKRITVLNLGRVNAAGKSITSDSSDDEQNQGVPVRKANPPKVAGEGTATLTKAETDAGGARLETSWIQGDNPRAIYLPHVIPRNKYRITLSADLSGGSNEKLGRNLSCEVVAEAMPSSFFFASKGTVLPAKQNGGLPVISVNVGEVDVQFLRVEPAQLPKFLASIVGGKKAPQTTNSEDDEYDNGYYDERRKPQGLVQSYQLDQLRKYAKSVYTNRFVMDARKNRRNVTHLPVEDIKELQDPGIYIAVMSEPGRFRSEYQTTYFYVSDIGLHARRHANGLDVFAHSLKTGKPMHDIEFKVLDENGKVAMTKSADGEGFATFATATNPLKVLTASRGNEYSILSLMEPALDLSEFDVSGHQASPTKVYAYAGRDIYRPGETFEASILVRDQDGAALPPTPIHVNLKRADGKAVEQYLITPDPARAGFLRQKVVLPQDAQTGTWALEFRVDPTTKAPNSTMRFQVEEFLPERMKLDLKAKAEYLALGDKLNIDVTGAYLYGAPAAGNKLQGFVNTERNRNPFAKLWPGFEFGDVADDALKQRADIEAINLSETGTGQVEVSPSEKLSEKTNSPLTVRATLSLLESGGRPVIRSIERTIFPTEKMVGVRPKWEGKFVREGSLAEFEVVRVDRAGKNAPAARVSLRLYREDRDYYWVFDDQRGWHSGYNEQEELVESRQIALQNRVSVAVPVRYGRYRLEVIDLESGAANRYRFYSGWGAQENESMGSRPDRVALKLDKANYQAGETAKLTISPPHDGVALITVEGAGVLMRMHENVSKGGTTVSIPIDKKWNQHNLYITTTVFRPGNVGEKITPARALGLTHLALAREDRKLKVAIDVPAKSLPDTKLKVVLKAPGLAGDTATATVYAVDVGILNVTNFQSPDAFEFFLGKQRYSQDILDIYGKFIETMEGQKGKLKFGGDARTRDKANTPKKVRLVDLYSGPVTLNKAGEAELFLDIPDFNGTLRVMAVVAGTKQFGRAEAETISAAPIVAELAMPRFVSPGDRANIALDVTNTTTETQQTTVTLSSDGPVKITGGTEQLTLAPMQKKTLRYKAQATDGAGESTVTVLVKAGTKAQPVNIKRQSLLVISPLTAAERTRRYVQLAPGETLKLEPNSLEAYYPGSALMSTTFSNVPPINVDQLVKGLLGYPYGCLEQTTSKAFPHLIIDDALAERAGLKPFSKEEREKAMGQAIARLAGLQRESGAFSLWGEGLDEPWLSAYALDFLTTAQTQGYSVPDNVLKRGNTWMLKQLQQAASSFPAMTAKTDKNKPQDSISQESAWWGYDGNRGNARESHRRLGALAYMGYVLSKDGKSAPLAALRILHDDYRTRSLSSLPLVHLAVALSAMGDTKRAQEALDTAFSTPYGMNGYQWEWLGDYGTQLRDTAMSVALMEKHKLKHPKAGGDLVGLLLRLTGNARWLSTQEQTALLLAARSFVNSGGDSWKASLNRNGKAEAFESGKAGGTQMREIDSAAVKQGASITNDGAKPLFVGIETVGYAVKPRETSDEYFAFRRTYYEPSGKQVGNRALVVGEQIIVHLEVQSKRWIEDAMVIDRIPAGIEIENQNLTANNASNPFSNFDPKLDKTKTTEANRIWGNRTPEAPAEAMANPKIKHREFRDDRFVVAAKLEGVTDLYYVVRVVTPGEFVIPAAFAEDMYRPEIRGSGAGSSQILQVNEKK